MRSERALAMVVAANLEWPFDCNSADLAFKKAFLAAVTSGLEATDNLCEAHFDLKSIVSSARRFIASSASSMPPGW